jgi:hypothetical protein
MVNCLARHAARRVSDPGRAINYRLVSSVRSAFDGCRTDPVQGLQRLWAKSGSRASAVLESEQGLRAFSRGLESGRIPKGLSMSESDGIDSFLGEQCRSRTRWTCVSG